MLTDRAAWHAIAWTVLGCALGHGPARGAPQSTAVLLVAYQSDERLAQAQRPLLDAMLLRRPALRGAKAVTVLAPLDNASAATAIRSAISTHRPTVLYAISMMLARIAHEVAPDTPLVFDGEADPVDLCLVSSLTRPGGVVTGYSRALPQMPKMLEALLDAYPETRRVIVPFDLSELAAYDCSQPVSTSAPLPPTSCPAAASVSPELLQRVLQRPALQQYAATRAIALSFHGVCTPEQVESLANLAGEGDAFLIPHHQLYFDHAARLVDALASSGRPAVFSKHYYVRYGAVMAVEPRTDDAERGEALVLIEAILGGVDPARLPVITPRGIELMLAPRHARTPAQSPSLQSLRRADQILGQ